MVKVKSHTRKTKSGKITRVSEHNRSSPSAKPKYSVKSKLSNPKLSSKNLILDDNRDNFLKRFKKIDKNFVDISKDVTLKPKQKVAKGWDLTSPNYTYIGDYRDKPAYKIQLVYMNPNKFLELQHKQNRAYTRGMSYKDFVSFRQDYKLKRLREGLDNPNSKIPVPYVAFDTKGKVNPIQEGRHRGLVVAERNEDIPVFLILKDYP